MSLDHKFFIIHDQVCHDMHYLLNRHKENRHKTLTDFFLHRINKRNTTSRFIRQCTVIKVPTLQLAKEQYRLGANVTYQGMTAMYSSLLSLNFQKSNSRPTSQLPGHLLTHPESV